jgi:hypothetical protein
MLFDKFVRETVSWWNRYLAWIADQQKRGNLDSKGGTVLFPNILLVIEVRGFLIAELIGARKEFTKLTVKRHKEKSIYRYLSQFDDDVPDPLIHLNAAHNGFRFICLAQEADFEIVKKRFPFIDLFPAKLNRVGGKGSVFSFGENFSSCFVENSVLINRRENIYRCKNILELFIVNKSITKKELVSLFEYATKENEVKGVHTVSKGKEESLIVGGHLQSMYLFPGLGETTIGEFIQSHPETVKTAFKTSHFEYEPYLEWLEHDGTVDDEAINPDLLVKRDDGFYDIYDLKTAALEKTNIVKGKRKRRRFIDYVEEGVAQLANYREYFKYPKNRELAKDKYGIEIDNPKLVLIVGNWENTDLTEIDQACRRYHDINIVDFDTFAHLFLGTEEANMANAADS